MEKFVKEAPADEAPARPFGTFYLASKGHRLTLVLDGDPGLGKSLLTLDLAARVTNVNDPYPACRPPVATKR